MTRSLTRPWLILAPPVITVPLCEHPTVSTVCTCGGLLAYVGGRWQHVEACIECYDSPHPCPNPSAHQVCPSPEFEVCAHAADWQCNEPVALDDGCAVGDAARTCCRCCWQATDDAEGRILWPR